jgi:hypothetical protein
MDNTVQNFYGYLQVVFDLIFKIDSRLRIKITATNRTLGDVKRETQSLHWTKPTENTRRDEPARWMVSSLVETRVLNLVHAWGVVNSEEGRIRLRPRPKMLGRRVQRAARLRVWPFLRGRFVIGWDLGATRGRLDETRAATADRSVSTNLFVSSSSVSWA